MAVYRTRYRLPAKHTAEIGRVVTRFAYFESRVTRLVYLLMEVDPKFGRIAVRLGRIEDAIKAIQDLMAVRGFATAFDFKAYINGCKQIETFRDRLSHGVWVKHTGTKTPVLQVTRGNFPETPGGKSIKARINPIAMAVDVPTLKSYVRSIDVALSTLTRLGKETDRHRRAWHRTQIAQLKKGRSRRSPRP